MITRSKREREHRSPTKSVLRRLLEQQCRLIDGTRDPLCQALHLKHKDGDNDF